MLSRLPFEFPAYLGDLAATLAPVPMAVAGAGHPLVMDSARRAAEAGFIDPILVGDADAIAALATDVGWHLAAIRVVPASDERRACETAAALARGGEVAAIMKGHVHTDALMRALLARDAGLRTDRRVSHIFHMTVPGRDRVLHITDAAVNIRPEVDAKLDIVRNAVDLAHRLGLAAPRVALLSGAETVNPSMPSSVEAAEVVRAAANGGVSGAVVDGPFGFDNAVSPEAARLKGIDSPVAGAADILVVPNLEAGNFLFKQMVYFMSATAAGIVMGAKVPVVLTSRADPPEARLAAAAIAAIVARH
ncbi:MAG: bifunctional enoyl-CoA hydratase/phosphate acetyltransferase [Rhodospirillales bacterium]|nr:MAG: bifunctional enoyl-CoA hydratase/phosphate acetyltransferase [Rhodospirillales bacterium]